MFQPNRLSNIIIGVMMLMGFVSCQTNVPSYVIPPKDLESLLYDIHIAEGLYEQKGNGYVSYAQQRDYYQTVLQKHGYSRQDYDTSLVWYGENMKIYLDVYASVLKRLEEFKGKVAQGNYTLKHTLEERINDVFIREIDSLPQQFLYQSYLPFNGIRFEKEYAKENSHRDSLQLSFSFLTPADSILGNLRASFTIHYTNDSLRHYFLNINRKGEYQLRTKPKADTAWVVKKASGAVYLLLPQEERNTFMMVKNIRLLPYSQP